MDYQVAELGDLFHEFFPTLQLLFHDYSQKNILYISEKAEGELVSELDFAVEERIYGFLESRFPACSILSEERGGLWPPPKDKGCFIIDPLDGTHNYLVWGYRFSG